MNLISLLLTGIAAICLMLAVAFWEGSKDDAPTALTISEPANYSNRIVLMSNGRYRVETYYKSGFWHAIGQPGNKDMDLSTAKSLLADLEKDKLEPTVKEVIP